MRETENRRADDERVSMWSVPRRFRAVYFPLFYFLGIIGIGWSVWYESSRLGSDASHHDIANAVIGKSPAILLLAGFISLVITEGSMVLAEMVGDYLKKRRERLEAAAIEKGLAEGWQKAWQKVWQKAWRKAWQPAGRRALRSGIANGRSGLRAIGTRKSMGCRSTSRRQARVPRTGRVTMIRRSDLLSRY